MSASAARHTVSLVPALALLGGALLLGLTGCARSRTVDRAKVLEAENINYRQKSRALEGQLRQAHAAQDEALAREQQIQHEIAVLRDEAKAGAEARGRLAGVQGQIEAEREQREELESELSAARARLAELEKGRARATAPAAAAPPETYRGVSPELEAMRRDLQQNLAHFNVKSLPVEIRTDRNGEQRVAIVLPDAFPSGKATLAYNSQAVAAVMGVGQMIKSQYPGSRVMVHGHTDSDPIRKSDWGTNERLSEARATAVRSLLESAGVSGGQIVAQGLGAAQPLEAGNTTRAKSRNRRVEIFISPR